MRILLLFVLALTILSCHKNDDSDTQLTYGGCDETKIIRDSITLKNMLLGRWKLTDAACGYCAPNTKFDWVKEKVVIASFSTQGTFSVIEEGIEVNQGTWQIMKTNDWTIIDLEGESDSYFQVG